MFVCSCLFFDLVNAMIVIFGGTILQVSHPLYDRFALIVRACCCFLFFLNFPVAMIVFFLKRGHLGLSWSPTPL